MFHRWAPHVPHVDPPNILFRVRLTFNLLVLGTSPDEIRPLWPIAQTLAPLWRGLLGRNKSFSSNNATDVLFSQPVLDSVQRLSMFFTGVCVYYDLFLFGLWYYEQGIRDCGTGCLYAEHQGAVGEVRGHVVTSCLHMSKCSPIIQHRHALIKSNPIFYQLIPTRWFVLTWVCARWIQFKDGGHSG